MARYLDFAGGGEEEVLGLNVAVHHRRRLPVQVQQPARAPLPPTSRARPGSPHMSQTVNIRTREATRGSRRVGPGSTHMSRASTPAAPEPGTAARYRMLQPASIACKHMFNRRQLRQAASNFASRACYWAHTRAMVRRWTRTAARASRCKYCRRSHACPPRRRFTGACVWRDVSQETEPAASQIQGGSARRAGQISWPLMPRRIISPLMPVRLLIPSPE